LAVVPAKLVGALVDYLQSGQAPFVPMCHGLAHTNHGTVARPGEFGPDRPWSELKSDAERAREIFAKHFGPVPPFFVPPFGCIEDGLSRRLQDLGFMALSNGPGRIEAQLARAHRSLALMPVCPWRPIRRTHLDVHIDPINWRAKTAHSYQAIERQLLGELRLRRKRYISPSTPIGLLTHHLVHDTAIWDACEDLVTMLRDEPAGSFPSLEGLMANVSLSTSDVSANEISARPGAHQARG